MYADAQSSGFMNHMDGYSIVKAASTGAHSNGSGSNPTSGVASEEGPYCSSLAADVHVDAGSMQEFQFTPSVYNQQHLLSGVGTQSKFCTLLPFMYRQLTDRSRQSACFRKRRRIPWQRRKWQCLPRVLRELYISDEPNRIVSAISRRTEHIFRTMQSDRAPRSVLQSRVRCFRSHA